MQLTAFLKNPNFHDYFVMAPLKLVGILSDKAIIAILPWLFCHGPIEATQI